MSNTLIVPAPGRTADNGFNPTEPSSRSLHTMYQTTGSQAYRFAMEMHRERLRQAEAQRLRRVALRARRSFASRLLG